ncbi:hypothetical protein ACVBEH_00630 [Roseateles sp. GG27B]
MKRQKFKVMQRGGLALSTGLLAALAGLPSAHAASTWQLDSNCSSNCVQTDGTVAAAAYSTSLTGSSNFAAASGLTGYSGGGLGVNQENTGVPNHALDNQGNLEMILLQFTQAVTLSSLNIGWADYDSDITVMAYQGPTTTNTSAAAGATVTAKNISNLKVATAGSTGWNLVGSYANVVVNAATTINASNLSSSWWLVSAYNSTIGGTVAGADDGSGNPSTANGSSPTSAEANAYRSSGYDYVKLFSVTGTKAAVTTNGSTVAEPGSLALACLAMLGLFYTRRQRNR